MPTADDQPWRMAPSRFVEGRPKRVVPVAPRCSNIRRLRPCFLLVAPGVVTGLKVVTMGEQAGTVFVGKCWRRDHTGGAHQGSDVGHPEASKMQSLG